MITITITVQELPDGSIRTAGEAKGDPVTNAEIVLSKEIKAAVHDALNAFEASRDPQKPRINSDN